MTVISSIDSMNLSEMANFNDSQRDRDRARRDKPSRFSDVKPRERSRDKAGRENTVFVSNIPYEYKWTDVKLLFRRHVSNKFSQKMTLDLCAFIIINNYWR